MRIERIEIDGFGRFSAASWPLEEGLTVFLGANEAGKTTLLNALRALLFGFEATRDGRTWYPALAGGRRGGRLLLRTARGERWTIERHGDRGGAGALAVRAPNGNQGGQETLDRLLHGADRDLFNNIFAFGLGELQTFSSLSADGVRGRIYGAGAGLGGTSAVDLERRLRQQLDGSFLPRGRERPLNQLLARIDELRREISDLARQPEEHASAHREREELRARATALRDRIRAEREQGARLGRLLDSVPIAVELGRTLDELAAGDPGLDRFPADAVAVLDRRIESRAAAETALSELDDEAATVRSERDALTLDTAILEHADAVEALREEAVAERAREDRRRELEAAAVRHAAALAEQVTRAGGLGPEALLRLDDSIPAVERTRALEAGLVEQRSVATEAERRRAAATEELETRLRESGPDPADEAGLHERAAALEELDALRLRHAVAEARRAGPRGTTRVAAAAALAAAVVAVVGGALTGQPAVAVVGAIAGVGLAATIVVLTRGRMPAGDLPRIEAERRELLVRAGLAPDASDAEVRAASAALAERRALIGLGRQQRASIEARRAEVERREREAADAAARLASAQAAWATWLRDHGLPVALTPDAARQVLAAAGLARRAAAERDHATELIAALDAERQAFAERVDDLAAELDLPAPVEAARRPGVVATLVERLERARESARRSKELDARLVRLEERRAAVATQLAERSAAVDAHLAALGCPDGEAVRARSRLAQERRELVDRARHLEARLGGAAGASEPVEAIVAEARAADPATLEAAAAEARAAVERLEEEERDVLNRIGALDARMRQLEATEELGARRQELAALEGQANALAREWAVRALTLRLLEETRGRYERERQPDVVRAAAEHFERVTGGRYTRIVAAPGDEDVRVETEGGEQRGTQELSRGTAEQLYLALRFGLIEEFARHAEPLPVVMDDILVNFDADRAARAGSAVRELATRHQVLYFTCHASTAELLDPDGDRTVALG